MGLFASLKTKYLAACFLTIIVYITILVVPSVFAHAELVTADPAPGTTLDFPPFEIVLAFNEPMTDPSRVLLINENFNSTELELEIVDDTLFAKMPASGSGVFTVQYDAVSADGHPISGSYEFAVVLPGGSGMSLGTIIAVAVTGLLLCAMMYLHFRSRARIRRDVRDLQQEDRERFG